MINQLKSASSPQNLNDMSIENDFKTYILNQETSLKTEALLGKSPQFISKKKIKPDTVCCLSELTQANVPAYCRVNLESAIKSENTDTAKNLLTKFQEETNEGEPFEDNTMITQQFIKVRK